MHDNWHDTRAFTFAAVEEYDFTRRQYYKITGHYIDTDGTNFGVASIEVDIPRFQGWQDIHSLAAYPIRYHNDEHALRQFLITRGRALNKLLGAQHRSYAGRAYIEENDQIRQEPMNGRLVIDVATGIEMKPGWDHAMLDSNSLCTSVTNELLLLITTPIVLGFSFGEKRWAYFSVSKLTKVDYHEAAFPALMLPRPQKDLLRALVTQTASLAHADHDVVQGKGNGCVVLLHGPPGTGKTLTAESICESERRPLYQISAGELGAQPEKVEASLKRILNIAKLWGTVLLLDEADIFLERRSVHDVQRNALVSIFLRMLDYHPGVIFLTTNRVEELDHAIQSRISVCIEYKPLSEPARRQIWAQLLSRAGAASTTTAALDVVLRRWHFEGELDRLSQRALNGREIRNVIANASRLALHQGEPLGRLHVETALTVQAESAACAGPTAEGMYY